MTRAEALEKIGELLAEARELACDPSLDAYDDDERDALGCRLAGAIVRAEAIAEALARA